MALDVQKAKDLLSRKRGTPGGITRADMAGVGLSEQELDACQQIAVNGTALTWQQWLQIIVQYGPQAVQLILAIIAAAGGAPVP